MLLDTIHSRQDLLDIPEDQLGTLCGEIRQFLVQNVSRTGGHLASNLGIVETTVAIHRVFDTSRDRLVFDVGHQCYVHKMLTGRMDRFDTLRQRGGLSGFPKPCESVHDAFILPVSACARLLFFPRSVRVRFYSLHHGDLHVPHARGGHQRPRRAE